MSYTGFEHYSDVELIAVIEQRMLPNAINEMISRVDYTLHAIAKTEGYETLDEVGSLVQDFIVTKQDLDESLIEVEDLKGRIKRLEREIEETVSEYQNQKEATCQQ